MSRRERNEGEGRGKEVKGEERRLKERKGGEGRGTKGKGEEMR